MRQKKIGDLSPTAKKIAIYDENNVFIRTFDT